MKLERYLRATSIDECIKLIADSGNDTYLLAGGTDLIPRLRSGKLTASTVIDISRVPELSRIEREKDGVVIGAMCRLRALQNEKSITGPMSVLCEGAGHVSSMQVRNVATLGGNICNASPSADTVPALLILDAVARIYSKQGTREVPLESFFTGPGKTVLRPDELLTGVFLPNTQPRTGAAYRKYAIRGDSDITIVGAGALVTLDADGKISAARIALASVGPTELRMKNEEKMLIGKRPDATLFKEVAAACAENISPITDQRATKEYRKEMTRVWVEDALKEAADSAGK